MFDRLSLHRFIKGLFIILLQVSTLGGRMRIPMTAYPPISCLDGGRACAVDSHCQVMLEAIPRICNITDKRCSHADRLQCRSVQKWLQLTSLFQSCHCQVPSAEAARCLELHTSIYQDPCESPSSKTGSQWLGYNTTPSPNGLSPYVRSRIRVIAPERSMRHMNTGQDNLEEEDDDNLEEEEEGGFHDDLDDDDMDEDDEDDEEEEEEDLRSSDGKYSCIGVRKQCLLADDCSQTLTDFRRTCRENKKTAQCVTTEKEECFETMERLRKLSEIFTCRCEHAKKSRPRRKCDRIQYRLANNTCLVEIPYLIHTSQSRISSYSDLLTMASSSYAPSNVPSSHYDPWRDTLQKAKVSTCVPAFLQCNHDPTCRMRMAEFLNMCSWNKKESNCNRNYCLATIRKFYLLVRSALTHPLLFCQCAAGDYTCEAIRQALSPTCSLVEMPSPSCLSIIERCEVDTDCRERWRAYERYCTYDKISGGCAAGPSRCRQAMLSIMGTVLTTNCTCNLFDHEENTQCNKARRRLQHNNVCKDMAYDDYNANNVISFTARPTAHAWPESVSRAPSRVGISSRQQRQDCLRNLANKIPSYMAMPTAVRVYQNDSECSNLCQCLLNGTLQCKKLPCSPALSCREKSMVYAHGSGFVRADRGQCRCIKAEVVCARPESIRQKQRTGLFLHVGYSLADRYLIEGNSEVKFDPVKTARKLGTLLNGDAAEQFCRLSLYYQEDGNLLFEIKLSRHTSDAAVAKVCESPTKALSYMINARHSTIVTDAQLSILKVAEMEMVQRLNRPLRSNMASSSLMLQARLSTQRMTVYLCTLPLSVYLGRRPL